MIKHAKLPLAFDVAPLRADLARVEAELWTAHFNTRTYVGDWSGVALRSSRGRVDELYPVPGAPAGFQDTPLLAACPAIQAAIARFACPIEGVRLLRLAPGARILEHRDYGLRVEEGLFRAHVPIVTNPDVAFHLAGERLVLEAGSCWYLDFDLPHAVTNAGTEARIHLVIDGVADDWVRALLARAEVASA